MTRREIPCTSKLGELVQRNRPIRRCETLLPLTARQLGSVRLVPQAEIAGSA
jgi:hypothetical protein